MLQIDALLNQTCNPKLADHPDRPPFDSDLSYSVIPGDSADGTIPLEPVMVEYLELAGLVL